METTDDIIDNTLEVVGSTMNTFDTSLGKVPIYKSGHKLGSFISRIIDDMVEAIPFEKNS